MKNKQIEEYSNTTKNPLDIDLANSKQQEQFVLYLKSSNLMFSDLLFPLHNLSMSAFTQ